MRTHLEYDTTSQRWHLNGWEFHCGDCFQVKDPHNETWFDVRIELSGPGGGEWYLVGLPTNLQNRQLWNFEARRYP